MSTKSRVAHSVADRVQDAVSPILWALGLELVEVVWAGQGSRSVLRIVIDKPGGVTVTDCERAHKALGPALDVADLIPHAYTLEVSSPGLDRPFKRLQDYQRAIGKDVSLKLRHPLNGQWRLMGRLEEVNEQGICLSVAGEATEPERVTLDRESIAEAKLVVKI
ncbi:MAG: ribosome maturation factor RimP [Nitrospira sp.]|nr:ribosome maturation factor RimP [Nitrospira sp.]MCP9462358.1 ribosome maturation factor RimP [Nitrospira sp.]MCP9474445.1 ribosome maturation factor RimP [Nitrospira sp.]